MTTTPIPDPVKRELADLYAALDSAVLDELFAQEALFNLEGDDDPDRVRLLQKRDAAKAEIDRLEGRINELFRTVSELQLLLR